MDENMPPIYSKADPEPGPKIPPPLVPPPPPPPWAHRGRGWMFFSIFLLVVLVGVTGRWALGVLEDLGAKGGALHRRGRELLEVVVEDHGSRNKIAVVDVDGLITGAILNGVGHNMVTQLKDELSLAEDDPTVKAVLLRVDSPGGEVMAADEISRAIGEFQKKSGKPVVASFGGLAASGGYYVSAPCRWIVSSELTITGSIGVIMHSYNYRGLLNKVGVMPEVFKSGRFKDMLSGEKSPDEVLPEERQMVQSLIDETFDRFKQVVAEGRRNANKENNGKGRTLVKDWNQYADGRILSGKQAYEYGFVDELGDFQAAFASAKRLAQLRDAQLIRYEQPFDLANIFRLFVKSDPPALKLDLGMELPKIQAGRLYFLSSTVLH